MVLSLRLRVPTSPSAPQGKVGNRCVGSVISGLFLPQALKKVRRPWNVERQEMMVTLVCSVGNATTDGKQVSISAYLLRV